MTSDFHLTRQSGKSALGALRLHSWIRSIPPGESRRVSFGLNETFVITRVKEHSFTTRIIHCQKEP